MWDSVWETIFSSRPWGRYPSEDLVRFVIGEAHQKPDRSTLRALEIGCGPGANLWLLAREGVAFDAVDGSESAIVQARERLDNECPAWRGRLLVGDFCNLPDDFSGYDFIIDSEALYCNSEDESRTIIQQIFDRLLPGGKFWSRTFAPGTWGVENGERIGSNYWLANEGPINGKGPVRLLPYAQIRELYGERWGSIQIGEITRHDGNPQQMIREWIIVARKEE